MGAVFEPFLKSGLNFTILQSDRYIEYFIDKLQIWEMGLAKTVAPSFRMSQTNYPNALFYFHPNP